MTDVVVEFQVFGIDPGEQPQGPLHVAQAAADVGLHGDDHAVTRAEVHEIAHLVQQPVPYVRPVLRPAAGRGVQAGHVMVHGEVRGEYHGIPQPLHVGPVLPHVGLEEAGVPGDCGHLHPVLPEEAPDPPPFFGVERAQFRGIARDDGNLDAVVSQGRQVGHRFVHFNGRHAPGGIPEFHDRSPQMPRLSLISCW